MSLLGSHRMQAGGELEPVLHPPGRLNSRIAPDACLRAGCNIPPAFPWPCSWQTLGTCLTRCREGVSVSSQCVPLMACWLWPCVWQGLAVMCWPLRSSVERWSCRCARRRGYGMLSIREGTVRQATRVWCTYHVADQASRAFGMMQEVPGNLPSSVPGAAELPVRTLAALLT